MSLPPTWSVVNFDEVIEIVRGVTFSKGERSETPSTGMVPCLRSGNVQRDLTTSNLIYVPASVVKSDTRYIRPGDTIVSMSNSYELVGKVALASERHKGMTFGAFLSSFRSDALDGGYLYNLLRSQEMQAAMRGTASQTVNISNLSMAGLAEIELPVPPLAEQRRIVAKLDALTARLARAREELDRVDARVRSLRSRLLELEFCLSHEVASVPLGTVASIISGNAFKSADFTVGSGIALVRIGDIANGTVDIECSARLPVDFQERHAKFLVAKDDILVALSGATTGKSGLFPHDSPALLNQRVARIRIVEPAEGDAEYVRRFTEFHSARILEAAYGAAQPNISHNRLKELQIRWPDAETRKARSSALFNRLAHADRLEAEAARARALLERLEAAILARAFLGELVRQDPNDEPAQTLLDRIRAERANTPKVKRERRSLTNV